MYPNVSKEVSPASSACSRYKKIICLPWHRSFGVAFYYNPVISLSESRQPSCVMCVWVSGAIKGNKKRHDWPGRHSFAWYIINYETRSFFSMPLIQLRLIYWLTLMKSIRLLVLLAFEHFPSTRTMEAARSHDHREQLFFSLTSFFKASFLQLIWINWKGMGTFRLRCMIHVRWINYNSPDEM